MESFNTAMGQMTNVSAKKNYWNVTVKKSLIFWLWHILQSW